MGALDQLRLCRALSGLIVDCVTNLTHGGVLQDESLGSYVPRRRR